jgi:diguanylate cyclase (GGDEF)-like protein/PAS domain S-box-containing protein
VIGTDASEPATPVSGSAIPRDSLLAVIDHNVDGMLVIDQGGVILLANRAAEHLLGRPVNGLRGTSFGAPLVLENATEIDVVAAGRGRTAEMRVVMIDWHGEQAFLASLRDVTDRKRAEAVLSRVGLQHAAIAMLGQAAVSGLHPDALMAEAATHVGRVVAADFAAVFRLSPEGSALRLVASQWSSAPPDPFIGTAPPGSQLRYTLEAAEPVVMNDARSEARFEAWPQGIVSAATVRISDHEQQFGVIQAAFRSPRHFDRDEISFLQSVANLLAAAVARSQVEGEIRHQALHDVLTGLPTRGLFRDLLAHALARSRRNHTTLLVLFADLDGFKQVNDSLGHHAGDEVLVGVAGRLTGVLRSSDSLARLGGDEFLMLLEDVEGDPELDGAVARVRAAITDTPFIIDGHPLALDVTIGVALADESHRSPEDLIRDADAAMYRAKQLGRGGYAVFDREMREHAADDVRVEADLRAALDAGQLRLLYQPIVALDDSRIVELEALLRWQHPARGLLEPSDFLDVAVDSGLIVPIGKWALDQACRDAATWQPTTENTNASTINININMAPSELAQHQLTDTIGELITQQGSPVRLQFELTESALIEDPSLPATLRDFKHKLGVRTALQNFGTGYSSLASLTRVPIDELKIDRSLIRALEHGDNAPIVAAIVNMAHALGILVVAEGVETRQQATEARRLGCDRGQGFFFAAPLPPETIATLLAQPTTLPARPVP